MQNMVESQQGWVEWNQHSPNNQSLRLPSQLVHEQTQMLIPGVLTLSCLPNSFLFFQSSLRMHTWTTNLIKEHCLNINFEMVTIKGMQINEVVKNRCQKYWNSEHQISWLCTQCWIIFMKKKLKKSGSFNENINNLWVDHHSLLYWHTRDVHLFLS